MKCFIPALVAAIFLVTGCATLPELSDEVVSARKTGNEVTTKVYPVDPDVAWEIAKAVFQWEKADEIDEHRNEMYMISSTGMKMIAFGSVMGVWIEPVDPGHTSVTVVCRRRVQWDRFTRLTAPRFYQRFEQGMEIVQGGKVLPCASPSHDRH